MTRPRAHLVVVALLLVSFAAIGIFAARTHTPTVDEFAYLPAGYFHLRTGDLTHDPTNPPLLKVAMALPLLAMDLELDTDPRWRDNRTGWGPWTFGTRFLDLNRARYLDAYFAARLVVLAIGVGLGLLVWRRARTLLSPAAALVTLALYCAMPPILGHAALATLDVGVTTLVFAAFVALDRLIATTRPAWAVATGLLIGSAFASKGVALLFVPLLPVIAAATWSRWDGTGARRFAVALIAMAGAAWITVLAVYGFSGFPIPAPVLEGLRYQAEARSTGEFPAFLNGEWSQTGWWYYHLVALALKTPVPTLVLLGIGGWSVARLRLRRPGDLAIVAPPLLLLYVLSFHYGKDYGVRYLLPAFPFLLLLAGRGVDVLLAANRRVVVAALVLWQLVSCTVASPHQLAWFNELVWPGDRARHLLLDSNLDWGQDLGRLRAYLDTRGFRRVCLGYFGHVDPGLYGIEYAIAPISPTPGTCAISANFLAGYPYGITYAGEDVLLVPPGTWSWFDRLTPVARIGRSIYVFDVTEDDVRRLTEPAAR